MRIGALGTFQLAGASLGGGAPPSSIVPPGPVNLYGYINNPLNVSGRVGNISVIGQIARLNVSGRVGNISVIGQIARSISITGTIWKN